MKPTREQIKEAFKKTIERWEKIVKDPDYYAESYCHLCTLENGGTSSSKQECNTSCPIRRYKDGKYRICCGTPFFAFMNYRTEENARRELAFLREVYIDFLEQKEEGKKEACEEDITEECIFHIRKSGKSEPKNRYFLEIKHNGDYVGCSTDECYKDEDGYFSIKFFPMGGGYRFEIDKGNFRIVKGAK